MDPIRVIEGNAKPFEPFWNFKNASESESGEVELEFNGPISEYSWLGDEVTPAKFKKDLYEKGNGQAVTMLVNSPGGEVIAASVIRSILQEYPGKVTADIVGLAASAATIVITGADHIRMRESGLMMIHDPSTVAWGTIDDIKKTLEVLKTVKESIISTYQTKTGMDEEKLSRMMTAETWMTAQQAREYGFVDEVVTASIKKAKAMTIPTGFTNCLKNYVNVPAGLIVSDQPVESDKPAGEQSSEPPAGPDPREVENLREYLNIFSRGGKE